jgi:hypothetical protein
LENGEKKITIGLDRREVEKAMLAISPDDAAMIKKFTALLYGKPVMKMANLKPPEFFTTVSIRLWPRRENHPSKSGSRPITATGKLCPTIAKNMKRRRNV